MPTGTPTSLGRFQAPEPPSALMRLHFHDGVTALREVDHEPRIAVLDQEDLDKQGIDVSTFIPGAPKNVKALGSCTGNTLIEAFSNILSTEAFAAFVCKLGAVQADFTEYQDTVAAERAAIGAYHAVTDLTGQSASEWPPTDSGSSGPYLYQWALAQGLIGSEQIAHGADSIVSLMQADGVLIGSPWFNLWFEPDAAGFIDGKGTIADLQAAIQSGCPGGHEYYGAAIEKLALLPTGVVDAVNTVIRCRNHWTESFGDHGSFRMHLSTVVALGNNIDARQFAAAS